MLQFLKLPTLAADEHMTALQSKSGEQKKLDPETPSVFLTARYEAMFQLVDDMTRFAENLDLPTPNTIFRAEQEAETIC